MKKVFFILVAGPLKKYFFAASLCYQIFDIILRINIMFVLLWLMKNKYKDGLGKGENHANLSRYYVELRIRIRVFFCGSRIRIQNFFKIFSHPVCFSESDPQIWRYYVILVISVFLDPVFSDSRIRIRSISVRIHRSGDMM